MKTRQQIIKATSPEKLFSKMDKPTIIQEYREMVKAYHPDLAKGESDLFIRITELKNQALALLSSGMFYKNKEFIFMTTEGKEYRLRYRFENETPFGKVYLSDKKITYVFTNEYKNKETKNLYIKNIESLLYPNKDMKKEFSRYFPKIEWVLETKDATIIVLKKECIDAIPLSGILQAFPEGLDPKQVAWIISSLCNILCYFYYNKKVHLGLTIENYFISMHNHLGYLYGGWEYLLQESEEIVSVPLSVYKNMSDKKKKDRIATYSIMTNCIKDIGYRLLGEKYTSRKNNPKLIPIINWLSITNEQNPYDVFSSWKEIVAGIFGKRKFIQEDVNLNKLYK